MEEKDKNNDEPKNNDESKKNNEPQHIGDIMNNIPFVLDALARERKKLNDLYTKAIMDNLASHHIKLQILDALYHQAGRLINQFEHFFLKEQQTLADFGQHIIENSLSRKDIFNHIHKIEDAMMDFEKRQDTIRNNLILITEKLTDKEDKDEHKEKIIDFSASFTELYVNTYDLMHQFGQLNNII